jgi:hypothetical protein
MDAKSMAQKPSMGAHLGYGLSERKCGECVMNGNETIASGEAGGERLRKLLFQHPDHRLRNVKFFRGSRDIVSPAELEDTVHSAVLSKRTGHIAGFDEFPDVSRPQIEARDLVKNL